MKFNSKELLRSKFQEDAPPAPTIKNCFEDCADFCVTQRGTAILAVFRHGLEVHRIPRSPHLSPASPGLAENKTWNAADPTSACKVDGLYSNYGRTWAKHYRGYSQTELVNLPRDDR